MKLDKQRRILIPSSILKISNIDTKEHIFISFCRENNEIILSSLILTDEEKSLFTLSFSSIDEKNRITLPKDLLILIEPYSYFIIFVRQDYTIGILPINEHA